jgi:hypothetical protein
MDRTNCDAARSMPIRLGTRNWAEYKAVFWREQRERYGLRAANDAQADSVKEPSDITVARGTKLRLGQISGAAGM